MRTVWEVLDEIRKLETSFASELKELRQEVEDIQAACPHKNQEQYAAGIYHKRWHACKDCGKLDVEPNSQG